VSELAYARLVENLTRLRLRHIVGRLDAVLSEAAKQELSYVALLDKIIGEEVAARQEKGITMNIKIAHFPTVKTLDDFDFKFQPSVDQRLIRELAVGRFVANAENVLIFGPPGVGKTHLAIALGRAAVYAGHPVQFVTATGLLAALSRAENEGTLEMRLATYAKAKLLVVDELGYLPFEKRSAHLFFQLVARRYEKGSMLITTNKLPTHWGEVFGDDVLAAAILDRLLHHSHAITIKGESYRLKQKKKAGLLTNGQQAPT
jgi:DNA replication protein DnaC